MVAIIALTLNFISCADDENSALQLDVNSVESGYDKIILQERNVNYPMSNYQQHKLQESETRALNTTNFDNFIGRSFRLNEYPYEDGMNVGYPIIDMDKYLSDYPYAVNNPPVKRSQTDLYAFSNYNRYEQKVNKKKTISGGLNLDFKVFSIGAKKKSTKVFIGSDVQENKRVHGELSVKFYDRYYELNIPTSTREEILDKYLFKGFTDKLYSNSIDEILDIYGGFVLVKFLTGGQAYALYDAEYKGDTHNEESTSEKSLEAEMKATINLQDVGGAQTKSSADGQPYQHFRLGRPAGTGESQSELFKTIAFSVRTIGGIPAYGHFTVPKEIDEVNFDLTKWCNSLSNKEELTIIELPEKSLIPITDFIEEDNLKEAFYHYYEFGSKPDDECTFLQEPCISIRTIFYNQQIAVYETSMKTRYGNCIVLRRASMWGMDSSAYVWQEAARIGSIFPNLKIEGMPTYYQALKGRVVPIDNINEFNLDNMSKFIDSKTGKTYLLTTVQSTGKKRAYTLYNDRVINDYIFKDIINALPVNDTIDLKSIRDNYYMVAL